MSLPLKDATFIITAVKPSGYPPPGPPEVAFAGRSNVGKSSLINTLTRRKKLVRVSGTPGRTQQINFFAINNDVMRLVDLPGYGYAKVPMAVKAAWRPMVEAYLGSRETLAGVVVILDIRREPTADDLMLLDWLRSLNVPPLVAITKADKLSKNQQNSRLAKLRPALAPFDHSPTLFSATTGLGREELWARICEAAGL
ncbi:MAG: ribosome biogenesis GTP-binding protein YihA/YsxC [Desulfarculaceae bacterium]|nr:ribosome biogenesis GTP-binding protein YihA/YsxC [Desulfarculaceae bacterium]